MTDFASKYGFVLADSESDNDEDGDLSSIFVSAASGTKETSPG